MRHDIEKGLLGWVWHEPPTGIRRVAVGSLTRSLAAGLFGGKGAACERADSQVAPVYLAVAVLAERHGARSAERLWNHVVLMLGGGVTLKAALAVHGTVIVPKGFMSRRPSV